jgi:hypothetical protein
VSSSGLRLYSLCCLTPPTGCLQVCALRPTMKAMRTTVLFLTKMRMRSTRNWYVPFVCDIQRQTEAAYVSARHRKSTRRTTHFSTATFQPAISNQDGVWPTSSWKRLNERANSQRLRRPVSTSLVCRRISVPLNAALTVFHESRSQAVAAPPEDSGFNPKVVDVYSKCVSSTAVLARSGKY